MGTDDEPWSLQVLEKRYTDLRHEIDRALGSGERVCREDLVRKVLLCPLLV